MYENCQDVPQGYRRARDWDAKAATQNNDGAQMNLGFLYQTGKGVKYNKVTAKEWSGKACDNGNQNRYSAYKTSMKRVFSLRRHNRRAEFVTIPL